MVKINLKEDANIIQQKGRRIPKATEITEESFVSPAVITVKKDKSVKKRPEHKKTKRSSNQKKGKKVKMDELKSRILRKLSEGRDGENLVKKLDFDYAYGQTRNLCIFTVTGGEFTWNYRVLKGLYRLADKPTIFQEWIDETLEFKQPALLKDTKIVTKGSREKHGTIVKETMKKVDEAGYKLHTTHYRSRKKAKWVEYNQHQNRIRLPQDKLKQS